MEFTQVNGIHDQGDFRIYLVILLFDHVNHPVSLVKSCSSLVSGEFDQVIVQFDQVILLFDQVEWLHDLVNFHLPQE